MPGLDFLKRERLWLGGLSCLAIVFYAASQKLQPSQSPPIVWEEGKDKGKELETKSNFGTKAPDPIPEPTEVVVDVDGAVKVPGVYTLPAGSRLKDALARAGGPLSNADLTYWNRAAVLKDGTKILVLKREANQQLVASNARSVRTSSGTPPRLRGRIAYLPPAHVEVPADFRVDEKLYRVDPEPEPTPKKATPKPKKAESSSGSSELPVASIPVNLANAEQLCQLPGIGPSLAEAILEYRRQNGPFLTFESLTEVSGIGPKKLEQIRPYVRL
ncbi:hypothetical protein EON81_19105 [bacterium]|nr:MAG: hypothetical protein EON81_19105 [bacterium]